MRIARKFLSVLALACGACALLASGQQPATTRASTPIDLSAYSVSRETTLTGTVASFTPVAQTIPLGPHLTLQTSNGVIDVHLGDARLLIANHFSIHVGDSLRIIGEPLSYGEGTQFVARILQKGAQVLAVRSPRGIPLSYMPPRNATQTKSQAGVR